MILGIGCDIIESERIERLLTETEKIDRIFTESERKYCDGKGKERSASYAARFAAKEAAAKAFGCGIGPVAWTEIETVKETDEMHLSVSHEKNYAVAYAIWEGGEHA